MGGFLVFLGLLLQCGFFPMSAQDCSDTRRDNNQPVQESPAREEAP